jgi:hypothetical protein
MKAWQSGYLTACGEVPRPRIDVKVEALVRPGRALHRHQRSGQVPKVPAVEVRVLPAAGEEELSVRNELDLRIESAYMRFLHFAYCIF